MLYKITVGLKTENGKCLVTLPKSEYRADEILSSIKIFKVNENRLLFSKLSDLSTHRFSINYEEDFDRLEFCDQMLEFLKTAGAHSAILNTVQQGFATVNEVNILEVYN